MTSEQVMLTAAALLIGGCQWISGSGADPLYSPYSTRRVWAVAPLHNESGSLQADGVLLADHLARQLENASNIDVLPVNRTLAAMETIGLAEVSGPEQALRLLGAMGVDGLVVGTITAYDPYDPPKLGLAIELYTSQRAEQANPVDVRQLARAATDEAVLPPPAERGVPQPVNTVSAFFDAADPNVRGMLRRYAEDRGADRKDGLKERYLYRGEDRQWHLYRISMDLYSEFVSYVMSWRLMFAEQQRVAPQATPPAR